MPYLYETHLHTSQSSACGRSTGSEHVRFYKKLGYQGVIITDHFFGGNTAVPRDLPWQERIERFCAGYEEAFEEGKRCGLDVFFGWEQGYGGKNGVGSDEYLIYGLDKAWLLAHPEVEHWTRKEQLEGVHRAGGCVIQAHPFRNRDYISRICLARDYVDGVEVGNAGNEAFNDAYALRYAKEYDLAMTAGSDNHLSGKEKWVKENLMGIVTQERLTCIGDLVRMINNKKGVSLFVPEGRFAVNVDQAPRLETFWLDEREQPVATGRDWLHETL